MASKGGNIKSAPGDSAQYGSGLLGNPKAAGVKPGTPPVAGGADRASPGSGFVSKYPNIDVTYMPPDNTLGFGNPGSSSSSGGGTTDPRPGLIAAAQAAANKEKKSIGDLYNSLSATLGLNIPGEDKNYDAAIGNVGSVYDALRGQVSGAYGNSRGELDSELGRLGQGDMLGQLHAKQDTDQNWLQSILGAQGQGTKDSLGLLKQGAHSYNTAVTGMAKTEGTNQIAAITAALAKQLSSIRSRGGGGSSSSKNPKLPDNVTGLLAALGGSAGSTAMDIWNGVLGSSVGQMGNPRYGFDAKGNKIITGYDKASDNQLAGEYSKSVDEKFKNQPHDAATLKKLALLIAKTNKYAAGANQ